MINCLLDTQPIPEWAKYVALTDTDYVMYFSDYSDAKHYARLNECSIVELSTWHEVINTFGGENNELN